MLTHYDIYYLVPDPRQNEQDGFPPMEPRTPVLYGSTSGKLSDAKKEAKANLKGKKWIIYECRFAARSD